MVVSWTSATNCARLYNATLSGNNKPPPGWQFGFTLESDHVWNGFVILCLLEDLRAREQTLVVQHKDIEDKDRYKEAMRVRNRRLRLYSQPELLHYCNKCTRFLDNGKNSLRVSYLQVIGQFTKYYVQQKKRSLSSLSMESLLAIHVAPNTIAMNHCRIIGIGFVAHIRHLGLFALSLGVYPLYFLVQRRAATLHTKLLKRHIWNVGSLDFNFKSAWLGLVLHIPLTHLVEQLILIQMLTLPA